MAGFNRVRVLISLIIVGSLAGCPFDDGDDSSNANQQAQVARVEIQQSGQLLTQVGDAKQLSAIAIDAKGQRLNVPIAWTSLNTAVAVIDGQGKVASVVNNGSTQITADAGGIKSSPIVVVAMQTAPNATVVTDTQIIGDPYLLIRMQLWASGIVISSR